MTDSPTKDRFPLVPSAPPLRATHSSLRIPFPARTMNLVTQGIMAAGSIYYGSAEPMNLLTLLPLIPF